MKLNGNAVKPGNVIEHNGRLWTAVKVAHVKPGKGGAFAQIELRDIRDGTKLNERFRSSETVERVILDEDECHRWYLQVTCRVYKIHPRDARGNFLGVIRHCSNLTIEDTYCQRPECAEHDFGLFASRLTSLRNTIRANPKRSNDDLEAFDNFV